MSQNINPASYTRSRLLTLSGTTRCGGLLPDGVTPDPAFPNARALYIEVGGALKVITSGGDTDTYGVVPAGYFYGDIKDVIQSGTTATGIHALY